MKILSWLIRKGFCTILLTHKYWDGDNKYWEGENSCNTETELSISLGGQMKIMNTVATNRISFAQKTAKISYIMLNICTSHEKLNNFRTAPHTVQLIMALPIKKRKKKTTEQKKKETEALKWQMRTNSPHSIFHKGEKQTLCFSMFPPRAAATLMVSCSWQQVQGLFSSGFHDASHGCAPRQCCPCSELVRLFSSPQTSISLQEVSFSSRWSDPLKTTAHC